MPIPTIKMNKAGQVILSFEDYMAIIALCEKIDENYYASSAGMKLRFTQRNWWPSVKEMKAHHVEERLDRYLPYLIYYGDVYQSTEPSFKETEAYEIGLTDAKTPFGHTVPVYDMERTVCDLLRGRSRIEIQVFQDALKLYVRRKDKNLRTLMQYAALFHVEKMLRQYLEVLL